MLLFEDAKSFSCQGTVEEDSSLVAETRVITANAKSLNNIATILP
jgi:hypothetical protein